MDARGGEILPINKLIAVAAVANDPDFFAVVNELEQDSEQSKATHIDNSWAANSYYVEVRTIRTENPFTGKFRAPVKLYRIRRLIFFDLVAVVASP